ncbi:T9SS type A sorting domain-containing protein [Calditrichota bacterium]
MIKHIRTLNLAFAVILILLSTSTSEHSKALSQELTTLHQIAGTYLPVSAQVSWEFDVQFLTGVDFSIIDSSADSVGRTSGGRIYWEYRPYTHPLLGYSGSAWIDQDSVLHAWDGYDVIDWDDHKFIRLFGDYRGMIMFTEDSLDNFELYSVHHYRRENRHWGEVTGPLLEDITGNPEFFTIYSESDDYWDYPEFGNSATWACPAEDGFQINVYNLRPEEELIDSIIVTQADLAVTSMGYWPYNGRYYLWWFEPIPVNDDSSSVRWSLFRREIGENDSTKVEIVTLPESATPKRLVAPRYYCSFSGVVWLQQDSSGITELSWWYKLGYEDNPDLLLTGQVEVDSVIDIFPIHHEYYIDIFWTETDGDSISFKRMYLGYWNSVSENRYLSPATFNILPAYPNPFNNGVRLGIELNLPARPELEIFDINGRSVYKNVLAKNTGTINTSWNANGFPSGTYFVNWKADQRHMGVQKIILIK